jgi:hypothetical protein
MVCTGNYVATNTRKQSANSRNQRLTLCSSGHLL